MADLLFCVHGYDGSSNLGPFSMRKLEEKAKAAGWDVDVIDLPGTNNLYNAAAIAVRIAYWPPDKRVVIVGHSMGCLSSREYLKHLNGAARVAGYIAVDGPEYGTWDAARPWTWCPQIWPTSSFIRELNDEEDGGPTPGELPYVQLIVKYRALLPGVYWKNVAREGVDHRNVIVDPPTMDLILRIAGGDFSGLEES